MTENRFPQGRCPAGQLLVNDDLCLDYLLGLLAETEAGDLMDHVRICPACEEVFRQAAGGHAAAEARAEGLPTNSFAGFKAPRPTKWYRKHRLVVGGLSGLAALLAVMILGRWPSDPGITHPRMVALPNPGTEMVLRSGPGADRADLAAGLEAYEQGDYASAVMSLTRAVEADSADIFAQIYLGSALGWTDDFKNAASLLEPVSIRRVPSPWADEVGWILACAWSGLGEQARADSLVNELAGRTGLVGDRARDLKQR